MQARRALFSIAVVAGSSTYQSHLGIHRYSQPRLLLGFGHDGSRPANRITAKQIYHPLEPNKNEIRLLTLRPESESAFTSELHCTLRVVSLDDKPEYTALSYTWGEPIRRSQSLWSITGLLQYLRALYWKYFCPSNEFILLDGMPYQVTYNLARALECLRQKEKERILWVDALCINQQDHEEKAEQVQKMRDIYSHAKQTQVWLGPCADGSDAAMAFIRQSGHIDVDKPNFRSRDVSPPWSALQALFARSWWARIWIVQEVFLSRRVVVQCGDQEVDMSIFTDLVKKEQRLRQHLRQRFHGLNEHVRWNFVLPGNPFYGVLGVWQNEQEFQKEKPLFDRLSKIPFVSSFSDTWFAYSKRNKASVGSNSFGNWLFLTQAFDSTLKRDKIYAVLGLVREEDKGKIIPDYSDSTTDADVFKQAAVHVLGQDNTLALFTFARVHGTSMNLPSWIPDFSCGGPVMFDMSNMGYTADSGFQTWAKLTPRVVHKVSMYSNSFADIRKWMTTELAYFIPFHVGLLLLRKSQTFIQSVTTGWHYAWYANIGTLGTLKFWPWREHYNHGATFSENSEIIHVQGLLFDEIAITDLPPDSKISTKHETVWMDREAPSAFAAFSGISQVNTLKRKLTHWENMAVSFRPPNPPAYMQPWHKARHSGEAFWRTMLLDRFRTSNSFERPPSALGDAYKELMGRSGFAEPKTVAQFTANAYIQARLATSIMVNTDSRAFILTSTGAMGFAPDNARPGDVICVIRGGRTPFVLRPREDNKYELVGPCFIYGIMGGQFARSAEPKDVRAFSIL